MQGKSDPGAGRRLVQHIRLIRTVVSRPGLLHGWGRGLLQRHGRLLEEPQCMQGYFEGYKCLSLKVTCDMEAERKETH